MLSKLDIKLLGLCPLLAVTNNIISSLILGGCFIIILLLSSVIVNICKKYIDQAIKLPCFMLAAGCATTLILFIIQYYIAFNLLFNKYITIYIALIAINCITLWHLENFAYKKTFIQAFLSSLKHGFLFFIVLFMIGAIRELIGNGTLFFKLYHTNTFIIAILPPGAFFIIGLLIAINNYLNLKNLHKNNKNIIYEQTAALSSIPKISTKKS